jgi:hypothetical protein
MQSISSSALSLTGCVIDDTGLSGDARVLPFTIFIILIQHVHKRIGMVLNQKHRGNAMKMKCHDF